MWDLSQRSVRRILRTFREAGLVYRVRGKGTFVGKEYRPVKAPEQVLSSAERLAGELLQLMRRGELRKGDALAPIKDACGRYRVTPATVVAAYRSLVSADHAVKVGRRYYVGDFASIRKRRDGGEVLLGLFGMSDFAELYQRSRLRESYRRMERELVKQGVCVRHVHGRELWGMLSGRGAKRSLPSGIVLTCLDTETHERTRGDIRKLARSCRGGSCRILVVSHDTRRRVEGVWYVSHADIEAAVSDRLADYIRAARFEAARLFVDERSGGDEALLSWARMAARVKRAAGCSSFEIVVKSRAPSEPSKDFVERMTERLGAPFLLSLKQCLPAGGDPERVFSVVDDFSRCWHRSEQRMLWLFARDGDAVSALRFAQRQGVLVPRDAAVMGLENDPQYCGQGLSCCVPDWDAVGYQMAHVLTGDFAVEAGEKRGFTTQALLLNRRTSPAV
jgi:DNA-binding transcriptional regulator YhcF (GntR family)